MKIINPNWVVCASALLLGLSIVVAFPQGVSAQEFRKMNRIARPPALKPVTPKPKARTAPGRQSIAQAPELTPVSRAVAEKAIGMMVGAWNNNTLENVLADSFFDKSRLTDAMGSDVPRDALLSVLAIEEVQTLKQNFEHSVSGSVLNSTVSITVRTLISFNDPVKGYQRIEGENEYIIRIRQRT
jgi:hypothetical protein